MKKAVTQGKTVVYVDMTDEEEAALIMDSQPVWHSDRPIQLLLTYEQNALLMQSDYGVDMLSYFKSIDPPTFNEPEGIYIYLNELFDAHKLLLESFEIIINQKS